MKPKSFGAFAAYSTVGDKLGLRPENESADEVFEQLCKAQARASQVDAAAIERVAQQTRTCQSRVRGVGSFYSLLDIRDQSTSEPIVRICNGPACCLRGASELIPKAQQSPGCNSPAG